MSSRNQGSQNLHGIHQGDGRGADRGRQGLERVVVLERKSATDETKVSAKVLRIGAKPTNSTC